MGRRNGYTGDIRWSKVYFCLLCYGIVIVIATLFITWIVYEDASSDLRHQQSYNESVEEFNMLPQYKRIIITEWIDYEVDENHLRTPEPAPTTFAERFRKCLPYGIIIILVILSIGAFNGYADEKSCRYFYADFPFDGIRSCIIFILMWACWPILLISLVNLRRWEAKQKAEQEVADKQVELEAKSPQSEVSAGNPNETENSDETNIVQEEEDNDEYVTYEDLSADRTHFSNDSCEQFIEYCQKENQYEYEDRLNDADDEVQRIERSLRRYGRDIQKLQGELKDAKLNLEKIKNSKPPEPKDPEALKAEWENIKNMRGVTNIYYDEHGETLYVEVAVRVAYEDEIYDFGDYKIEIHHDEIECPRIRSGVRDDWDGGYPDYCYGNSNTFCLGTREENIKNFISERRFREAIILIIDCMHSVNDEAEAEDIPSCFRRIVPPKEG